MLCERSVSHAGDVSERGRYAFDSLRYSATWRMLAAAAAASLYLYIFISLQECHDYVNVSSLISAASDSSTPTTDVLRWMTSVCLSVLMACHHRSSQHSNSRSTHIYMTFWIATCCWRMADFIYHPAHAHGLAVIYAWRHSGVVHRILCHVTFRSIYAAS